MYLNLLDVFEFNSCILCFCVVFSHDNHDGHDMPTPADIRRRNAQFEHKNKTGTGKAAKPVRENVGDITIGRR
ncbi:hypothetical protein E3P98_02021 [Wallemia ichthyophaga]|nr:hypothetical protein E3P98_02021 [Wallemia ichthyophaga]